MWRADQSLEKSREITRGKMFNTITIKFQPYLSWQKEAGFYQDLGNKQVRHIKIYIRSKIW